MTKIKLYFVKTLDGFTTRANGCIDFISPYIEDSDYNFSCFFKDVNCVLMNSAHYDEVQTYEFDWHFENIPYYIMSNTARGFKKLPNVNFLLRTSHEGKNSLIGHLRELQSKYSNIWLMGDSTLISDCFNLDVIDEITFITLPITIGFGDRLYMGHTKEGKWKLINNEAFSNGVTYTSYRREINL